MRNLKLLSCFLADNNILKGSECFCVGARVDSTGGFEKKEFGDVLFVYCNHRVYCLGDNGKTCSELFNFENYYKSKDNVDFSSVSVEYNHINDSIVIALKNGDIFSLECQTKTIDCIGSVESGLKAMGFSPDLEVLVLATGGDTLILMDGLFNPIVEVSLNSNEPVEKQMVNVGWGKKETQFHGSEGKSARTRTIDTGVHPNLKDDHGVRISWREDSSLFAISFWCSTEDSRKIKIYNNCGKLQCNNEMLPGLEQTLSWRPCGNVIAFGQTLPNKHVIAFLEKNGLRHGEFNLLPDTEVKEICWNINSTIMCIVCEKSVQLWTMDNYHWYLKQQINYPEVIISVKWHPETNYRMLLLLSNGLFYSYSWIRTVDRSPGVSGGDRACVAVIDGSQVLLTCFKQAIIPPPMATYTIRFDCPVNAISFLQTTRESQVQSTTEKSIETKFSANDFVVLLSDNSLKIVRLGSTTTTAPSIQPLSTTASFPDYSCQRHLLWVSPKTVLLSIDHPNQPQQLFKFNIDSPETTDSNQELKLTLTSSISLEFSLRTMSYSTKPDNIMVHGDNGTVYNCSLSNEFKCSVAIDALEHLCEEITVCEGKKLETIVTLDGWNHLLCQGELVSTKATSFFVQAPYLIFTTDEHELLVHKIVENMCRRISSRRLERGARIVTVFNDTVVLQLPRGNLETIQPRALVLNTVAGFLEKLEYKEAFNLMRRQRIHLNLFVDHHPQVFLLTAAKFIQRIDDTNHLNIFLSELNDKEDVTRTIYKDFYDQEKRPPVLNKKLNTVCSCLREVMSCELDKYLLPILTAYVRVDEMASALKLAATSDQALRHLIFLADVDKLYDRAISLYEIDLALKIAAESKKDPKEYLPYLNGLKSMDPVFMRFAIDCHYKNYESALKNICKSEDGSHFAEALDLIQKTALYPLALDLYRGDLQRYKMVASKYAVYLFERKCFEEAAIMFSRSGDLEQAMCCYAKCGLWRSAVTLATKLNFSEERREALGEELFAWLSSQEQWSEAANVARDVLRDEQRSIECLVEARQWLTAFYLIHNSTNVNYPVTRLVDSLSSAAHSLIYSVEHELNELDRFSTRLNQVRIRKAQRAQAQAMSGDIDINDLQSEISSSSSSSSWSSRSSGSHSSKSSRKMQRNLWSLKEGNPREEFSLLLVITEGIERLEKMTSEAKLICAQLVGIDEGSLDHLAYKLQKLLSNALDEVAQLKKCIWPLQAGSNEETLSTELADTKLKFPPVSSISRGWKMEMLEYNHEAAHEG